MRILIITVIIFAIFCSNFSLEEPTTENPMITHPEWYIKILDWSFYVAWGGVAMLDNVTIENTSDIAYENIKVRVRNYSTTGSNYGFQIGQEIGFLPVELPPHSKDTYLKGGSVLGLGSFNFRAGAIEVLGAKPITNWNSLQF